MPFQLKSQFHPTGDQPQAIDKLVENLRAGVSHQALLGVTGSGKTFTMANVIAEIQKPTLVISHNKTLAAQLYEEFRDFFPDSAVHYFVSYYDYYQPEAYLPRTDTYIEKDAKINALIDSLRHASTASLLTRQDVIIVASVSCIYGVGSPEEYLRASLELAVGSPMSQKDLSRNLVRLQYVRNTFDPRQGHFHTRETVTEIYLPSGEETIEVEIERGRVVSLAHRPAKATSHGTRIPCERIRVFPAKHFVTPQDKLHLAMANIKQELDHRLGELNRDNKVLEAARLKQRTEFDLEMLGSTDYVNGIENYSRQLDFRPAGSPPHTLIDYFRHAYGDDFLTFIDESHVTIPQLRGMYNGDRARKQVLVDYGFRLPSAMDNRPLTFEEFSKKIPALTYVSATPAPYELKKSGVHLAEQVIRPTSIPDPVIEVRPTHKQIADVVREVAKVSARGQRALVMALTKRLAEDIASYLQEEGIRAEYLHAEIKTLDRPAILKKLRAGECDALVGINLLREGIDLPEVSFIAILDADKEGFLRNRTTLLQITGRAARHPDGRVVMYADRMTDSMRDAMQETARRRQIQIAHNRAHGLAPGHIKKEIRASSFAEAAEATDPTSAHSIPETGGAAIIASLEKEMRRAARELDFERAAKLRNRISTIRKSSL